MSQPSIPERLNVLCTCKVQQTYLKLASILRGPPTLSV